ncbi:hypothetical protein [Vallitalea okinawensis]|uniref:hypothetical protein n=1 Tax=Vallitalea okinawensis TaxID=2078660 RepID=UPI000CFE0FC8|nr:hypothetical protein [Vallitalea okinawensis]
MIYSASLSAFVKKALGQKAFQTNINKIIETLPVNPKESNMDAVVIGPKDLAGISGKDLIQGIHKKHEAVGVIYVYQKEKDAKKIEGDILKIQAKKMTSVLIEEAVSEVIELKQVGKNETKLVSSDSIETEITTPPIAATVEIPDPIISDPTVEADLIDESVSEPMDLTEDEAHPMKMTMSLEERIAKCGEFGDWDLFKRALEKDVLFRELLNENTQYAGVVNMLEVLDRQIANTFKDTSKTAEQKFMEIKEIGLNRSAYKATQNNIIAEKVMAIMTAIVASAEATVDKRVNAIRSALDKMSTSKVMFADQDKLRSLINERLEIQTQLLELTREIIEVYKSMDATITEIIEDMDEGLPSENPYINEIMKPAKRVFTPQNAANVASKLMSDLQNNRVSMSLLEGKIKNVITLVFKLCEADDSIIDYQQKLITLLSAQRIEDVIIVDSIIKNSLRLFVGPSEVGRTSTALTWGGILSRRQNTLLIDLTGSSKLRDYGVEPVTLDDFLANRVEKQFLCVEGYVGNEIDQLDEIVGELKTRLNYYPYINLILDTSQQSLLDSLTDSALTVHFITDCTPRGIALTRDSISNFKDGNIAKKIVLIDPPIDPIKLLNDLTVDPLLTKLVTIPHLAQIRACSLKGIAPYDHKEIIDIFEEAFR